MIERRTFLQSLVTSVAAGKIILEAKPADVERFALALNEPVRLAKPSKFYGERPNKVMPGETLYNADGQPVAMVRSVTVKQDMIDITSVHDVGPQMMPGLLYIEMECDGI